MNLVLTQAERRRARLLIGATAKHGADATRDMLAQFRPDAWPALIAFLASIACEATIPTDRTAWRRGQPDVYTEAQRRTAHRQYAKGNRSPEVVAAEREYQRIANRIRRAAKA